MPRNSRKRQSGASEVSVYSSAEFNKQFIESQPPNMAAAFLSTSVYIDKLSWQERVTLSTTLATSTLKISSAVFQNILGCTAQNIESKTTNITKENPHDIQTILTNLAEYAIKSQADAWFYPSFIMFIKDIENSSTLNSLVKQQIMDVINKNQSIQKLIKGFIEYISSTPHFESGFVLYQLPAHIIIHDALNYLKESSLAAIKREIEPSISQSYLDSLSKNLAIHIEELLSMVPVEPKIITDSITAIKNYASENNLETPVKFTIIDNIINALSASEPFSCVENHLKYCIKIEELQLNKTYEDFSTVLADLPIKTFQAYLEHLKEFNEKTLDLISKILDAEKNWSDEQRRQIEEKILTAIYKNLREKSYKPAVLNKASELLSTFHISAETHNLKHFIERNIQILLSFKPGQNKLSSNSWINLQRICAIPRVDKDSQKEHPETLLEKILDASKEILRENIDHKQSIEEITYILGFINYELTFNRFTQALFKKLVDTLTIIFDIINSQNQAFNLRVIELMTYSYRQLDKQQSNAQEVTSQSESVKKALDYIERYLSSLDMNDIDDKIIFNIYNLLETCFHTILMDKELSFQLHDIFEKYYNVFFQNESINFSRLANYLKKSIAIDSNIFDIKQKIINGQMRETPLHDMYILLSNDKTIDGVYNSIKTYYTSLVYYIHFEILLNEETYSKNIETQLLITWQKLNQTQSITNLQQLGEAANNFKSMLYEKETNVEEISLMLALLLNKSQKLLMLSCNDEQEELKKNIVTQLFLGLLLVLSGKDYNIFYQYAHIFTQESLPQIFDGKRDQIIKLFNTNKTALFQAHSYAFLRALRTLNITMKDEEIISLFDARLNIDADKEISEQNIVLSFNAYKAILMNYKDLPQEVLVAVARNSVCLIAHINDSSSIKTFDSTQVLNLIIDILPDEHDLNKVAKAFLNLTELQQNSPKFSEQITTIIKEKKCFKLNALPFYREFESLNKVGIKDFQYGKAIAQSYSTIIDAIKKAMQQRGEIKSLIAFIENPKLNTWHELDIKMLDLPSLMPFFEFLVKLYQTAYEHDKNFADKDKPYGKIIANFNRLKDKTNAEQILNSLLPTKSRNKTKTQNTTNVINEGRKLPDNLLKDLQREQTFSNKALTAIDAELEQKQQKNIYSLFSKQLMISLSEKLKSSSDTPSIDSISEALNCMSVILSIHSKLIFSENILRDYSNVLINNIIKLVISPLIKSINLTAEKLGRHDNKLYMGEALNDFIAMYNQLFNFHSELTQEMQQDISLSFRKNINAILNSMFIVHFELGYPNYNVLYSTPTPESLEKIYAKFKGIYKSDIYGTVAPGQSCPQSFIDIYNLVMKFKNVEKEYQPSPVLSLK